MTKSAVATISSTSARPVVDAAPRLRVERIHGLARVDDPHHEHGAEPAHELGDPVGNDVAGRELPGDREAGAHRRVEVAAREMAEGRDREREPEAEAGRDPERPDRVRRRCRSPTAIPLKPRKKKRNVPSASATRRTPSG